METFLNRFLIVFPEQSNEILRKIGYLGSRELQNSFSMPTKIHIKLRKLQRKKVIKRKFLHKNSVNPIFEVKIEIPSVF